MSRQPHSRKDASWFNYADYLQLLSFFLASAPVAVAVASNADPLDFLIKSGDQRWIWGGFGAMVGGAAVLAALFTPVASKAFHLAGNGLSGRYERIINGITGAASSLPGLASLLALAILSSKAAASSNPNDGQDRTQFFTFGVSDGMPLVLWAMLQKIAPTVLMHATPLGRLFSAEQQHRYQPLAAADDAAADDNDDAAADAGGAPSPAAGSGGDTNA